MKYLGMLSAALGGVLLFAAEPKDVSYKANLYRYGEAGHALDMAYENNGQPLDVARWDLAEAKRQGRDIPEDLIAKGEALDKELFDGFIGLENRRAALRRRLMLERPIECYTVAVENLVDAPISYYDWLGFCSFELVWPDGTTVMIPVKSFSHCVYNPAYNNGKGGKHASIFVYARQSTAYMGVSEFPLPNPLPAGNPVLKVSGMDCDKGGPAIPVRIMIHGNKVFEGRNPFPKQGIGFAEFPVKAEYLAMPPVPAGGDPVLAAELDTFAADIAAWNAEAAGREKEFIAESKKLCEGLVYKPRSSKEQMLDPGTFILAIDINDTRRNGPKYPGFNYSYERLGKMAGEAHANMYSIYVTRPGGRPEVMETLKELDKYTTVPFSVWAVDKTYENGDFISTTYFGRESQLEADNAKFVAPLREISNWIGIQVDEPVIEDTAAYGKLADNAALMAAWREYAATRNPVLAAHGLKPLPDTPTDAAPSNPDEWAAFMEYQQFKSQFMARHYLKAAEACGLAGELCSPVIQDMNTAVNPAAANYETCGVLPLVGTDLYDNGSIRESVSMQLLNNAALGRALMWPGAGYSCRAPRNLARSFYHGVLWADGIQVWTLMYFDKYRDPNAFWPQGGNALAMDDRGADLLNNWNPYYWRTACKVFADAEVLGLELAERESLNPVALLISRRTLSALAADQGRNVPYFLEQTSLYSEIAGRTVPCDVRYVETLDSPGCPRYEAMVLADAECLSDDEIALLEEYVENGGTLIVTGSSGTRDEWFRPREWKISGERVVRIPQSAIGKVVDGVPNCSLAGLIAPDIRERLLAVLRPVADEAPVKVEAPYGTVASIQRNALGHIVVFLLDYMNEEKPKTAKITYNGNVTEVEYDLFKAVVLETE
ncbi:MAG: hypothetical protein AB7F40_01495 [Victivallaceae bacterium]|nr:hypothetical protein [Victivallaceae bacterium]